MLVEWREKSIGWNYDNKRNDKTNIHFSLRVKQLGLDWLLSIKKLTYFQVCLWYAEIQRLKSFELFGDKFIITTCRYNSKINVVIVTYYKTTVCVYRNHSITSVGSYILDHSHGCFIFVSHAILQNGWIERYKEIKNFIIAGVLFFQLNYLLSK